jgi:prephenate dehydrogenase
MNTLVVGAGEMGGWFAEALVSDASAAVDVVFCDRDEAAARESARAVGATATAKPTGQFDLVCIAVPIPAATAAIQEYSDQAGEAIVDVTGTMQEPVEAMRTHAPDCQRASLHPLFSPANEPGNVPLVVDEGGPVIRSVREALDARGNDVFETTPAVHDEAMETVQARTHAAVLAFGLAATDVPERFQTPISQKLVTLAKRVTDGDGRVYADIQTAFEGASDVAEAADELADADAETFERLYDRASLANWEELSTETDEDGSA